MIEELKVLNAEGLSSTQIAARMGNGLSRNSIIGKLTRLAIASGYIPTPGKKRNVTKRGGGLIKRYVRKDLPELPPQIAGQDIPLEQRKSFMQLNGHDCRWPYGEVGSEGFFFCGAETEGASYCPTHYAQSRTNPSREPRRKFGGVILRAIGTWR